jgi:hypothetical protein
MKANRTLRKSTLLALSGVAAVGLAVHGALAQTTTAPAPTAPTATPATPAAPATPSTMDSRANDVASMDVKFADADVNKDGFVDRIEAAAIGGLAQVFDKADTNGDGKLDRMEYSAAMAMMKSPKQ